MALHAKAKAAPGYRFYALYDKISREDILAHAWRPVPLDQAAPGTDGQDFADVEARRRGSGWPGELRLRSGRRRTDRTPSEECSYRRRTRRRRGPSSGRWASRPCATGLHDSSDAGARSDLRSRPSPSRYAYRQAARPAGGDRGGEDAVRGHPEVVDADLADYFGSIPHAELMLSLARRIVDRRVLHLIEIWLECAVEETDDRGRKTRTTEAKDRRRGIPQGSRPADLRDSRLQAKRPAIKAPAASQRTTSSARDKRLPGTATPSARAVFRLISSSNFCGCWTGRSAGLAPLKIRST